MRGVVVTAPDPGLTDLIAAHTRLGAQQVGRYLCLCGWVGDYHDHPAHVALVVEQHTNGRITEANARARARVKAANKRASIRITQIRKEESARFEAEGTIARVEKLAHDMRGWCSPHGISVTYSDRIRAALEGES